MNLSGNSCSRFPSAYCGPTYKASTTTCFVSYCSIRNNTATESYGLCFNTGSSTKYSLSNSNLIENDIEGDYGLVYCDGKLSIDACTILLNEADPIFFTWSSSSITITNCRISGEDVKKTEGTVITGGNAWKTNDEDFMNEIEFTVDSNLYCFNTIPEETPKQTPQNTPNETPFQTPFNTPMNTKPKLMGYTWYCDDIIDNRNPDVLTVLEFLLIISFLPTDPAKDIWYDVQ